MKLSGDKGLEDLLHHAAFLERGVHTSHFHRRIVHKAVRRGLVDIKSKFYDDGWLVVATRHGTKVLQEFLIRELT